MKPESLKSLSVQQTYLREMSVTKHHSPDLYVTQCSQHVKAVSMPARFPVKDILFILWLLDSNLHFFTLKSNDPMIISKSLQHTPDDIQ